MNKITTIETHEYFTVIISPFESFQELREFKINTLWDDEKTYENFLHYYFKAKVNKTLPDTVIHYRVNKELNTLEIKSLRRYRHGKSS